MNMPCRQTFLSPLSFRLYVFAEPEDLYFGGTCVPPLNGVWVLSPRVMTDFNFNHYSTMNIYELSVKLV